MRKLIIAFTLLCSLAKAEAAQIYSGRFSSDKFCINLWVFKISKVFCGDIAIKFSGNVDDRGRVSITFDGEVRNSECYFTSVEYGLYPGTEIFIENNDEYDFFTMNLRIDKMAPHVQGTYTYASDHTTDKGTFYLLASLPQREEQSEIQCTDIVIEGSAL